MAAAGPGIHTWLQLAATLTEPRAPGQAALPAKLQLCPLQRYHFSWLENHHPLRDVLSAVPPGEERELFSSMTGQACIERFHDDLNILMDVKIKTAVLKGVGPFLLAKAAALPTTDAAQLELILASADEQAARLRAQLEQFQRELDQ